MTNTGPVAFQPRLSFRKFHKASCKHTHPSPFRSERHCARLAKRSNRSVAVLVRTTEEQQVAHDAALTIVGNEPLLSRAHERRLKAEFNPGPRELTVTSVPPEVYAASSPKAFAKYSKTCSSENVLGEAGS